MSTSKSTTVTFVTESLITVEEPNSKPRADGKHLDV
jgi:hypothetical protein